MSVSKGKGTRTVKPVYAVMQVKDSVGDVISLTKENVTILSVHKSADDLLAVLEGSGLPEGAFYKRIALA
tara:strand:+ start:97 stop:306 length:210 start_codon:yes stop_codon:yes gene_type:complete